MSEFALTLVKQLHRPRTFVSDSNPAGYMLCAECRQLWPCETIKVIEGAAQMATSAPEPEQAPVGPTPRPKKPRKH